MKKLEREALTADRDAVRALLSEIPASDVLGRWSFEARLNDIERRLSELEDLPEVSAKVALMFGGEPVTGSRSIDAQFATDALSAFQALVAKKIASDEFGQLGSRGPLPLKTTSNLAISDIVRGSVGFMLEERTEHGALIDTVAKQAVHEIARVISNAASEDAMEFEQAFETIDSRLLVSLSDFFQVLDTHRASVRIVEGEEEVSLRWADAQRALVRISHIVIDDQIDEHIVGELLGLLPESRKFEMRLRGTGEIIKGPVGAAVAPRYLEMIESADGPPVGKMWRTRMRVREVRERNRPPRRLYTLLGLIERVYDTPLPPPVPRLPRP